MAAILSNSSKKLQKKKKVIMVNEKYDKYVIKLCDIQSYMANYAEVLDVGQVSQNLHVVIGRLFNKGVAAGH